MCSYANFSLRPLIAMILAVMMLDSLQHHPRDSMHWHRQLDTSWCISSIWIAFINTPWNTSGEKKILLYCSTKKKKKHFFPLSSSFLQGPQRDKTAQSTKDKGCCNQGTPWLTWKQLPSRDCISLHPLFLSQAAILGVRLSCSHVFITEMW